jgi:nitroimidazol reductase NimA-like FMN-containing flavoprotein (pyridoxamine 5'-phosphate oxidase superfamily)
MDQSTKDFVLDILNRCTDLTLATVRPDGYPQATTVSYANDGLTIYVIVGRNSQKANNIRNCNKVSLTVDLPYADWNHIKGLSMGATARILDQPDEIQHAGACMMQRFPKEAAQWAEEAKAHDMAMLEIKPQVVSVLDYEKGFGHTDLVTV